MKRKIVSVLTACVVAVTMAVGFFDTAIQATNVPDVLPASGVALALGEGVAFEVIDAATSENGVISENESDVAATEYNSEEVTVSENLPLYFHKKFIITFIHHGRDFLI